MSHVLVTFLGKGKNDLLTGYQRTDYRFPDGNVMRGVPYLGLALTDHLKPDRVIVLGTPSSMWDVFLLDRAGEGDSDALSELVDAVASGTVSELLLERFSGAMEHAVGCPFSLAIIPFGRDMEEQTAILGRLAKEVGEGDRVSLDVTHGFRHLPLIGLVAARFLARVRGAKVEDIYYGAFDMRNGNDETSVLNLKGLLHLLDWVDALASYDKDGDYGVFAGLLQAEGMPASAANLLRQAAFFERTTNPVIAHQRLMSFNQSLQAVDGHCAALFTEELAQRVAWAKRPQRHLREAALSRAYLERRDYLRATVFLQESAISRETERTKQDTNIYLDRKASENDLKAYNADFKVLAGLRNAMVHGTPDDRIPRDLKDEKLLGEKLRRLLSSLTGA